MLEPAPKVLVDASTDAQKVVGDLQLFAGSPFS